MLASTSIDRSVSARFVARVCVAGLLLPRRALSPVAGEVVGLGRRGTSGDHPTRDSDHPGGTLHTRRYAVVWLCG